MQGQNRFYQVRKSF